MKRGITAAQVYGNIADAFAAVRLAEERIARMQQLCASALNNKSKSKLIRLNAGASASEKEKKKLFDVWLAHMRMAL